MPTRTLPEWPCNRGTALEYAHNYTAAFRLLVSIRPQGCRLRLELFTCKRRLSQMAFSPAEKGLCLNCPKSQAWKGRLSEDYFGRSNLRPEFRIAILGLGKPRIKAW